MKIDVDNVVEEAVREKRGYQGNHRLFRDLRLAGKGLRGWEGSTQEMGEWMDPGGLRRENWRHELAWNFPGK